MPKKLPSEFERDVVTVARRGDLTQAEVAADFGISAESVRRRCQEADVDDGIRDGLTFRAERARAASPREATARDRERDPSSRRGVLRCGSAPKMMVPLVLELAAAGIPVRSSCRVLGFSTQAFYKWRANPVCDRHWDDVHLVNAIVDIHADDPEFRLPVLRR